jgi:hypothetical protein
MLATSEIRSIRVVDPPGGGEGARATADRIAATAGATVRVTSSAATADGAADLFVMARSSSPHTLGSETLGLLLTAHAPVLLLSGAKETGFDPTVLPVGHADLEAGGVESAIEWALLLANGSSVGGDGTGEVRVLHVASDPDEFYRDLPVLSRQVATKNVASRITLRSCFRWGAHPVERILSAVRASPGALLILRRRPTGDATWYRALSAARCSVLLLPPEV